MLTLEETIDAISALEASPDFIIAACQKIAHVTVKPVDVSEPLKHIPDFMADAPGDYAKAATEIYLAFGQKMSGPLLSLACTYLGAVVSARGVKFDKYPEIHKTLANIVDKVFSRIFLDRMVEEVFGLDPDSKAEEKPKEKE